MTHISQTKKREYGDFQTPLELAESICEKLIQLGVSPDAIVEPTCGLGNFIEAATYYFKSCEKIIGVEINSTYLQKLQKNPSILNDRRVEIKGGDFFEFDWLSLASSLSGKLLVIGNFPWLLIHSKELLGVPTYLLKIISNIIKD